MVCHTAKYMFVVAKDYNVLNDRIKYYKLLSIEFCACHYKFSEIDTCFSNIVYTLYNTHITHDIFRQLSGFLQI